MNPDAKAAWLAALRDPRFRQCKFRLRQGGALCVLGVLCHVMDPTRWVNKGAYGWIYGEEEKYLPKDLAYEVCLTRRTQDIVSTLNDMEGYALPLIADYIERIL